MVREKTTRKRIGGILLGAGILAVGAALWPHGQKDLKRDAHRIAAESHNFTMAGNISRLDIFTWQWATPGELARLEAHITSSNTTPGVMFSSIPANLQFFNVATRSVTTQKGFNEQTQKDKRLNDVFLRKVSPDGRWSLCSSANHVAPWKWCAVSNDNNERCVWWYKAKSDFDAPFMWLPDSSGWVFLKNSGPRLTQAEFHSLTKPAEVAVVPLAESCGGGMPLGWLPDRRLLIGTWGPYNAAQKTGIAYFSALDLSTAKAAPRLYTLPAPVSEAAVWWVALTPKGDRFAWVLYRPPGKNWLQRVFDGPPFRTSHSHGTIELWSTDTKGLEPRCLGTCPAQRLDNRSHLASCSWSPDGKQILYTLHGSVWTLDVE